jgi:hypothetical protein
MTISQFPPARMSPRNQLLSELSKRPEAKFACVLFDEEEGVYVFFHCDPEEVQQASTILAYEYVLQLEGNEDD